jgi:hypothetical protein
MLRNGTKDGIQGADAQASMVRDRDPLVKRLSRLKNYVAAGLVYCDIAPFRDIGRLPTLCR